MLAYGQLDLKLALASSMVHTPSNRRNTMTAALFYTEQREAPDSGDPGQTAAHLPNPARERRQRLRLLRKQLRKERDPSRTAGIPRPHESPQYLLAGSFGSRII